MAEARSVNILGPSFFEVMGGYVALWPPKKPYQYLLPARYTQFALELEVHIEEGCPDPFLVTMFLLSVLTQKQIVRIFVMVGRHIK